MRKIVRKAARDVFSFDARAFTSGDWTFTFDDMTEFPAQSIRARGLYGFGPW